MSGTLRVLIPIPLLLAVPDQLRSSKKRVVVGGGGGGLVGVKTAGFLSEGRCLGGVGGLGISMSCFLVRDHEAESGQDVGV